MDDARGRGVHSTLLAPRHPQGFHAGAPLRLFSQPPQRLPVEVSSTHGTFTTTEPTSPTFHQPVDAGTDRHRYPSLPALPDRNAHAGLRLGGLPTVGFLVRSVRSTRTPVFALLCTRANADLRPAVPFRPLFADARSYSVADFPRATAVRSSDYAPLFCLSTRCFSYNPHRQRFLPLPAL